MDLSEIQLLKKIREIVALSQKKALVGVGDDCAVLPGRKGYNYLFTTDSMVENVHFDLKFTSLYQVGWKVVAANASDIAAMGGVPLFAVVSLGLPERFVFSEVEELYRGMMDLSLKLGLEINGGDVVVSSVFFITLSVIGEVEEGRAILRSGAKPGDRIYLTGEVGGAAAGLFCLKNRKSCLLPDKIRLLEKRWLFPFPKCNEAQEIVKAGIATSMIDISDGLSSDLFHILEESGVGAEVWEDSLPVLSEVKTLSEVAGISYMDFVLNGGEDYQLLFTARGSEEPEKKLSFPVFEIGKIIEERGLFLVDKEGRKRKIKPGGWDHFPSKERKGK